MGIISRQIGWSQESNLLWQILKQLNRLTSIMFGLKPKYKVYTALLTQTGVDGVTSIGGGDLIIGVTYQIIDNAGSGWDFTNVGAPNNDLNTYFVATGTTPTSWGIDGQLDYNTGAPVVIVLENTIGNIVFGYGIEGVYVITCDNLFIENKTWYTPVIISNIANITNGEMVWRDVNEIRIITNLDGALADGVLSNTTIEIRIYN
jgi:hypothetical protein